MKTNLVGILNYTPDSFSDGDSFFSCESALTRIEQLFEDGADIVDIGATSTGYGKTLLSAEEEWERVRLLLRAAAPLYGRNLSFDTFHYQNAQKAIDLGVGMINDVGGARDQEMRRVIAQNKNVKYVFMYSLVLPANRYIRALNKQEIYDFGQKVLGDLLGAGIELEQIIFDPGIGFATNAVLSMEVISDILFFKKLGVPIYIGHSRKSFLETLTNVEPSQRDIETLAASLYMLLQDVDYIRVHNIAIHRRSFNVWRELSSSFPAS